MTKLLLLCFLALSASAEVRLQFWHSMSGVKGKLLGKMVDQFNEKHRGKVIVSFQFAGAYEEALNKLRAAILARKGPHIVQITDIGTGMMIDSGSIQPLDELIARDPTFPSQKLLPQVRRYYEILGRLYSLPFATSNPIFFYNVDWFEEVGISKPPETFDELKVAARKLTRPDRKQYGVTWPLHSWFFEQFIARQGKELISGGNGRLSEPQEVYYLSEEARSFVQLWKDMVDEGIFANVGRGWEPAEQNFLAGRSAMFITSTSNVFEVMKRAPFRIRTARIPTRDKKKPGGVILGGNSLWILKDKSEAEISYAYEFVKYMASFEVQKEWHANTGYFPIRLDVIEALQKEGFYEKNPAMWTAIAQLRETPDMPATRGAVMGTFAEAREHIDGAIEQILSGRMSVEEALGKAKTRTDDSLKRYLKMRKLVAERGRAG